MGPEMYHMCGRVHKHYSPAAKGHFRHNPFLCAAGLLRL